LRGTAALWFSVKRSWLWRFPKSENAAGNPVDTDDDVRRRHIAMNDVDRIPFFVLRLGAAGSSSVQGYRWQVKERWELEPCIRLGGGEERRAASESPGYVFEDQKKVASPSQTSSVGTRGCECTPRGAPRRRSSFTSLNRRPGADEDEDA